jgi:hypothetical protein
MARLLSVNVGLPRDVMWKGRTVCASILKNLVKGGCRISRLNLDGDSQTTGVSSELSSFPRSNPIAIGRSG